MIETISIIGYGASALIVGGLLSGIRFIQQSERGLIERFGKYNRYTEPGISYVIPFIEKLVRVNITEKMMEIDTQEIITEDNLNAEVDLVIFYKIFEDEKSIKNSVYKVFDYETQIIKLGQTTARNVIGTMPFKEVNSKRNILNERLADILKTETKNWGVEIIRVELKDITPPKEVQDTMNQVIQAENTKRAAIDFATAVETKADGEKRSIIKQAEGQKQSKILVAEGTAKAFELINKSFKGPSKELKQLEVTQVSLQNNAKIVLTDKGITPQLILGNIPIEK